MTYYLDANIVSYLLKGNKEIFSKMMIFLLEQLRLKMMRFL